MYGPRGWEGGPMDESVVVCAWALHVLHYGPDKDPGTLGGHEGTKWHSVWHKSGHRCPPQWWKRCPCGACDHPIDDCLVYAWRIDWFI